MSYYKYSKLTDCATKNLTTKKMYKIITFTLQKLSINNKLIDSNCKIMCN